MTAREDDEGVSRSPWSSCASQSVPDTRLKRVKVKRKYNE